MLTQHIALVPEAGGVDAAELARVSAALQKQMIRDLLPLWGIASTVSAFPQLEDVPVGYWPVIVTGCELGHEGGVHLDGSGQPYAQIRHAPHWSLAASRACLEMLVNPFEHRSVTTPSLRSDQGPVELFMEICAPCEDARHAYAIDDVLVADFCTPAYFGVKSSERPRYSYGGSVTGPMQLLPGGHLTWYDPVSGSYWLRSHWRENPVDTQLGAIDKKVTSLREIVNACASLRASHDRRVPQLPHGQSERAARASHLQAQRLRALLGKRLDQDLDAASYALQLEREGAPRASQPPPVPLEQPIVSRVTAPRPPVARPAPFREPAPAEFEIIADIADDHEDTEITMQYEMEDLDAPAPAPAERKPSESVPPPIPRAAIGAAQKPVSRPAPKLEPPPRVTIRPPTPSYAPVTLASVDDREPVERRGKLPLIAGLAALAAIALVLGLRGGGARPQAAAAPQKPAAAAPAKPASAPAAAVPAAAAPAASVPAAAPAAPAAPAARATAVAAPAARAKPQKFDKDAAAAQATRAARKALPPPAPQQVEHAVVAPATASIEDLIQTRK